ncbi:hypothetical protein DSO57_1010600 [Entomophthora muscae]|uniref:Uncharacterized protein n=1 Tax=Entomophthora muscae TaxID=34485 RepID=A0ACC2UR97_9FUNG|nr:hypothetical protein DSO57_1010600 [Entomophthora muscae]
MTSRNRHYRRTPTTALHTFSSSVEAVGWEYSLVHVSDLFKAAAITGSNIESLTCTVDASEERTPDVRDHAALLLLKMVSWGQGMAYSVISPEEGEGMQALD